jgi:hypothetical protein
MSMSHSFSRLSSLLRLPSVLLGRSAPRAGVAQIASKVAIAALFGLAISLVSGSAKADRYVVVYDDDYDRYRARSGFNFGFDLEGAAPISSPRFPSGNDLSGGGGFKLRFGDRIRFHRFSITPEGGYAFDHLFATDNLGNSYDWDMHRFFGGARFAFGRVVMPGFYAHLGYGWRDTGDPTVAPGSTGGLAFDAGFLLDFRLVPGFGFGVHAEYVTIDAQPYTPQWVAIGLHGDVTF